MLPHAALAVKYVEGESGLAIDSSRFTGWRGMTRSKSLILVRELIAYSGRHTIYTVPAAL